MSDTPNNGYDWLTLAEACQTLDISERTLHRYIKQGKYESRIEKGRRLIRLSIDEIESVDVRPEGEDLAEHLSTEVQYLRQQLSERDRQVQTLTDELRQLNERAADTSKRHDTIVLTLTQQLDKAHLQLEDLRTEQSQSWWRKLLMRKPLTNFRLTIDDFRLKEPASACAERRQVKTHFHGFESDTLILKIS